MPGADDPITASEARALFAPLRKASSVVIAVSGGPDSVALLWLMARWRRALQNGPSLVAATIDHGLRAASAREAREVKRLAASLGVPHVTRRWTGAKPVKGLPAAAREARYDLLTLIATKHGAACVATAHTLDDQAETVLMRLARGSGVGGLGAMALKTRRGNVTIVRPLLEIPKARLIATLARAHIAFADDPTNRDVALTRPRLRALLPTLAAEGLDANSLARLAMRMRRADTALDQMTEVASHSLALPDASGFDASGFSGLPDEVRIRLLRRAIDKGGHEGPAELGKVERLLRALDTAPEPGKGGIRLRQTLAGAVVTLTANRLVIAPAPRRRATRTPI